MRLHGIDVYRKYLAMKMHFSSPTFDYFQYQGKVKAKEETYQKRNDFYFFETLAKKLTETEVKEYLLSSFIEAEDPSKVWIGDIKNHGKKNWSNWCRRIESLEYIFSKDLRRIEEHDLSFNKLFDATSGHPPLLKMFFRKEICLETLTILDILLGFMVEWDRRLRDPLWECLSFKIRKYKSFMSINRQRYRQLVLSTFVSSTKTSD